MKVTAQLHQLLCAGRRGLPILLATLALFTALLTSSGMAGHFPHRPANATLERYTGILRDYGFGNGIGGFDLQLNGRTRAFLIGLPMRINGSKTTCQDPDPRLARFGLCKDWPSAIVLGRSTVTATCWSDTAFRPGVSSLFCDQIDRVAVQSHISVVIPFLAPLR